MTVTRKIIEIDEELCNGCGNCIVSCAEGAIEIVDGKAKVISDNLCDGLGACIGDCPEDALKIIERDADEFDEDAVHQHLEKMEKGKEKEKEKEKEAEPLKMACGCPSTNIQTFATDSNSKCESANAPASVESQASSLSNWPVQIRLVPPNAPFLKGADLLIPADCVPVAFPTLHRDFLKGKVVMMGCPKLDDSDAYVEKFIKIFKTAGIKSITCLIMEVPCCSGLKTIVNTALKTSGQNIPVTYVVINGRGQIVEKESS